MTVTPRTRRLALLGGLGAAVVVFVLLRSRSGPDAIELAPLEGAASGTSLDAGGAADTSAQLTDFVALAEQRLAEQDIHIQELSQLVGEYKGDVHELEAFLESLGGSLEGDQWSWPEEAAPPPTDPGPPPFPRVTAHGVEVSPGVFQPISWFYRALPFWANIRAQVFGRPPAPSYSQRNDPGPSGQAPPASPGNRRASPSSLARIRMSPVYVSPALRRSTSSFGGGLGLASILARAQSVSLSRSVSAYRLQARPAPAGRPPPPAPRALAPPPSTPPPRWGGRVGAE